MCQKDGMISTSICTFKNPDLKYLFSLPQTFLTSFLNMFCLLLQKKKKNPMQILEIWLTMVNNLSLFYLIQKYCEYIRYKKKKRIQDVYVYKNNKFTLC